MYETHAELDAFLRHFYQVRFVRELGEGAFGIAILVYDGIEQCHKVFKLPRNRSTTDALIHEGINLRRLRDLSHPNIIQLYQFGAVPMQWQGRTEERYFISMAFGGTSLRAKLGPLRSEKDEKTDRENTKYAGSGRRLPLDEVLRIGIDVCRGLDAAHGFRGAPVRMLHRDISPDNILIDDETGMARLSDFGIARVLDRSSTLSSFAGKFVYMDPHCAKGQASFHSDLYSLAIVLYEAATGELPFPTFQARLDALPKPPHELVPDLPAEFSAILMRALANDVNVRYETSNDLLIDLGVLHMRLNPLPKRYARLATMEDGRLRCEDREDGQQVAVRLVASTVSLDELREPRARLETLSRSDLELPTHDFQNKQHVGIVSRVPNDAALSDLCGVRPERCPVVFDAVAAVCDLLEVAHGAGVCHGFLSPHSISLTAGGPRIHELGLGLLFRGESVRGGMVDSVKRQQAYLSPRMLAGGNEPSTADDVYSVGAILYFLLAGAASGKAAEAPSLLRPLHESNPVVPLRLAALVMRCLSHDEQERPGSVAEVATALRAVRWPEDGVEALTQDALRIYPRGASTDALIEACERIDLALHLDPGNPQAHFTRGLIYVRNDSHTFAVEEFNKSARVAPGVEVYLRLGDSHEQLGDRAAAIAAYRKALEHGDSPEARVRLAELCPTSEAVPGPAVDVVNGRPV